MLYVCVFMDACNHDSTCLCIANNILYFFQPKLSLHDSLKSPFINSSSEGEFSDEYVVVGSQAKTNTQTSVVNTTAVSGSKPEGSTTTITTDNTDHYEGIFVTIPALASAQVESSFVVHDEKFPLTTADQGDDQNTVLLSSQLEQVRKDLQSILHRLNSLEVLLQRRRVRK